MSPWQRYESLATLSFKRHDQALATSDNGKRFFVRVREPYGEHRNPIEFYRWTLSDAQAAADRLVQAYYPHECGEITCGSWLKY